MFGLTVTVNVVLFAHWLPLGVKVYVAEFVLLTTAGLHVPVIPFVDVVGSTGTLPFAQIVSDVPKANTGVVRGVTVTFIVAETPHCPAVGVKV